MKNIKHLFSVNKDWQRQFAEDIKGEFIEDKIINIPKRFGSGHTYFLEITPGLSVLLRDLILIRPIQMTKLISEDEFYILHYSSGKWEELYCEKSKIIEPNLFFFNNQISYVYTPLLDQRVFDLSLFVEKKLMDSFVENRFNSNFLDSKLNGNGIYKDYIDSNSLSLILSLKEESISNISFDFVLKSICYKLLGNFLNRSSNVILVKKYIF